MRSSERTFGLVDDDVGARISGLDFLKGLLDCTLPSPPFADTADVEPFSVESGYVVFHGTPSARFLNPMGFVHGGWLSLLLDTAMGCAVHSTLAPGQTYTTMDLRTTFVRPVRTSTGLLRCEAKLIHAGGRIASSEGKILDADNRLIAHGSETCMIMALRPARSPTDTPNSA